MIKNYFRVAIRNLSRNKSYAFINVVGLAVGIAVCVIIFVLVQFELSFDNFHSNRDRIYRVVSVSKNSDGTTYSSGVPFPVADGLRSEFPQIGKVAAINEQTDALITILASGKDVSGNKFKEKSGVFYVEQQFFEVFDFKWLAGEAKTSLAEPNTVVLTQKYADKYFGNWEDAVGRFIKDDNNEVLRITGIIQNAPANSDFPLGVLISYKTYENGNRGFFKDWVSVYDGNNCFLLLSKKLPVPEAESFLATLVKEHKPPEYQKDELQLQPLADMHFDSRFGNYNNHSFSRRLIDALILIAVFLLIVACANFINLSTAQAVKRGREVGVRKVLGGNRRQLAIQFLSETALITFFAVLIGLGLAEISLPFLNNLLQVPLSLNSSANMEIIEFLIIVFVSLVAISGSYPAIVLSGFDPVTAIKSKAAVKTFGGISLRRGLVVFQFLIAQVLIFGMLAVINQMDYFKNLSLGFNKDAVVTVPIPVDSVSINKIGVLKNRLLTQSGIRDVSFSAFSPTDNSHWDSNFRFNNSGKATDFNADLLWSDADYFRTYDIKFVAGNSYLQSDTPRGFVVNETLLKRLGINDPQAALGKRIDFWDGSIVAPVVGVVKDFNDHPLDDPMSPVIMGAWKEQYDQINIKINPGDTRRTLAAIERIWTDTYPDYVYEYQFLDAKIDGFYKQQDQLSKLYAIFAGIAIFISSLGLYGLASFMAEQRTKEVGIRKVLGASGGNILLLFSREFALLISVAFALAAPLGYYIMNRWLENFAYHINIGVGLFSLTIFGTMLIAWLTIGYRTIKAATANPVESLRYE